MNLTRELVEEFRELAREYDGERNLSMRRELCAKIEAFANRLTEKQIIPFLKMVCRT